MFFGVEAVKEYVHCPYCNRTCKPKYDVDRPTVCHIEECPDCYCRSTIDIETEELVE